MSPTSFAVVVLPTKYLRTRSWAESTDDLDLVRHVLFELGALGLFDLKRALVLLGALARRTRERR